ncbi:holo-ACP synthase [Halomonas cibimaris]|uniref:Holo-[acyl-carrier-protein] synthase n=1 Tax=Halomonas cibimaris TaxID=657012 RepID=A0ABP7L4Y8_9GAMM
MIIGIGSDIARVARFEAARVRHGERFAHRLLGTDEQALFQRHAHPAAFLAKRFAGKEAFVKALGTGFRHGMEWRDIQVLNDAQGKPTLALGGRAAALAQAAGVQHSHITLSDEADYALAFVVLER